MAAHPADGSSTGQSALIVPVPEAEDAVGAWRRRYDPSAAAAVPAHVTVLVPFLPLAVIDAGVVASLGELFGRFPAFDVRFAECRRFPETLYLAPEPAAEFRLLTATVASRWPEAPPYGGAFADVVPHLTIAVSANAALLDAIEADVTGRLPVAATVAAVHLLANTGAPWEMQHAFPLAARASGDGLGPGLRNRG